MIVETETPADLDAISKWLDIAGNKLDYRRYGEVQLRVKTILHLQHRKILEPQHTYFLTSTMIVTTCSSTMMKATTCRLSWKS